MNNEDGKIWYGIDIDNLALKKSADASKKIILSIGESAEDTGKKMDKALSLYKSASENEKYLAELKNELRDLQLEMKTTGKYTGEMVAKEGDLRAEIAAVTKEINAERAELAALSGSVDGLTLKLKSLKAEFSGLSPAMALGPEGQLLKKEIDETAASLNQLKGKTEPLSREMQLQKEIFTSGAGSINAYKKSVELLTLQYNKLSESERNGAKGKALLSQLKENKAGLREAEKAMDSVTKKAEKTGNSITNMGSKAFSFLRTMANIIPGLGLAGLIAIVADGIVDAIKKLNLFSKAATDLEKTQKEINEIGKKATEGYVKQTVQLKSLTDRVKESGKSHQDKVTILKDYNKWFGETLGKVKSYEQAEKNIIDKGPAFIESLRARSLEMAAMGAAIESAKRGIEISLQDPTEFMGTIDKFFYEADKVAAKIPFLNSTIFAGSAEQVRVADITAKALQGKAEAAEDEKGRRLLGIYEKFRKIREDKDDAARKKGAKLDEDATKKSASLANRIFQDKKKLADLLTDISGAKRKYDIQFGLNVDSEKKKIDDFFDELELKIKNWNDDPNHKKSKILISKEALQSQLKEIEDSRSYAIGLADDKQAGEDLVKQLEEQKKRYEDYEDYKSEYGKKAADDLYGDLTKKYATYLDRLKAEKNKLEELGSLNPAKQVTMSNIDEKIVKEEREVDDRRIKWLAKALGDYSSYEDKRKSIAERYAEERRKATESGNTQLLAGINEAEAEELKSLKASNSDKLASMEQFAEGAVYLTKKAVQQQIEILENLLKTGNLPADITADIQSKIKNLNSLLTSSDSSLVGDQLETEIKKKEAALAALANAGDTSSEAFKRLNDELMRLKQEKAENSITGLTKSLKVIASLAPALNDLSEALGETNSNTAKQIGGVFASLANGAGELLQTIKKIETEGVSALDAISAAANFVISTIANIVSSAQAQKDAYENYYLQNLAYQHDYNNALIEEIRLREGIKNSVFFNDYAGKIKAGLAAEIESVKKYNEALADLQNSKVITGTKKVRDWAAVGASTAAGAAVGLYGSVVGPIGTALGTALGAAVGFIGGMLKKRTVVNIYDDLLKTYDDLITKEGDLNILRAEAIISSGKIEGSSKENLQYLISMNEQYEKAKEQIEGVISDLAGSLGSDLMSSLFDDWASGGQNVGKAFADGVSKSLANIGKNLLFNSVFGDDLVKLQDEIKKAFKESGDPNAMISSLLEFNEEAAYKGKQYQNLLEEYARQLKEKGIEDVFGLIDNTKDEEPTRTGASKGFASMSQDSATELIGRFTAVQDHTFQMKESLKLMSPLTEYAASISSGMATLRADSAAALIHLSNIDTNTARLQAIESDMSSVRGDIRAVKTGIDDINLKGIKIKT